MGAIIGSIGGGKPSKEESRPSPGLIRDQEEEYKGSNFGRSME